MFDKIIRNKYIKTVLIAIIFAAITIVTYYLTRVIPGLFGALLIYSITKNAAMIITGIVTGIGLFILIGLLLILLLLLLDKDRK